jgi:hypothetical protein
MRIQRACLTRRELQAKRYDPRAAGLLARCGFAPGLLFPWRRLYGYRPHAQLHTINVRRFQRWVPLIALGFALTFSAARALASPDTLEDWSLVVATGLVLSLFNAHCIPEKSGPGGDAFTTARPVPPKRRRRLGAGAMRIQS